METALSSHYTDEETKTQKNWVCKVLVLIGNIYGIFIQIV